MMEQMLKLCMFLRRAKLTFMAAIEYRDSDCTSFVLTSSGSSPMHEMYSCG